MLALKTSVVTSQQKAAASVAAAGKAEAQAQEHAAQFERLQLEADELDSQVALLLHQGRLEQAAETKRGMPRTLLHFVF